MKSCAPSTVGACPQPAAMRLHNGAADGQPHAAALRLGRKECREHLVHPLRWQPHAGVTDRELELTVLQFRLHRKLSAGVLHGLDAVKHEVHEHLLQLHTVYHDFREFGRKVRAHGNRKSIGLTFQQREHFVNDSVRVDEFTVWRRRLVARTNPVDDFSRTIPILIDSGCCCTGPIKSVRVVRQPFNAAVGAGDGGGNGLFDFVRQRRGHFPQHGYSIDVCQIVLELTQSLALLFCTFAIFNVREGSVHLSIFPCWSRSGTPRTRNQRYSPSAARRNRASSSKSCPVATEMRHFSEWRTRSSGWIARCQPAPEVFSTESPLYSVQRLFTNVVEPSDNAVKLIAGIVSTTSRRRFSWLLSP